MGKLVDVPCDSLCEALDAFPEHLSIFGLADEMNVILLNAEMNDSKTLALGSGDAPPYGVEHSLLAQARAPRLGPQDDVDWMTLVQLRSNTVNLESSSMQGRLAPGVLTTAASSRLLLTWWRLMAKTECLLFANARLCGPARPTRPPARRAQRSHVARLAPPFPHGGIRHRTELMNIKASRCELFDWALRTSRISALLDASPRGDECR